MHHELELIRKKRFRYQGSHAFGLLRVGGRGDSPPQFLVPRGLHRRSVGMKTGILVDSSSSTRILASSPAAYHSPPELSQLSSSCHAPRPGSRSNAVDQMDHRVQQRTQVIRSFGSSSNLFGMLTQADPEWHNVVQALVQASTPGTLARNLGPWTTCFFFDAASSSPCSPDPRTALSYIRGFAGN